MFPKTCKDQPWFLIILVCFFYFTWFYTINIYWHVKSYNFTSKLIIITILFLVIVFYALYLSLAKDVLVRLAQSILRSFFLVKKKKFKKLIHLLSKVELMEKSYRKRDNKEVKRISTPDSINPSNSTKLHRTWRKAFFFPVIY